MIFRFCLWSIVYFRKVRSINKAGGDTTGSPWLPAPDKNRRCPFSAYFISNRIVRVKINEFFAAAYLKAWRDTNEDEKLQKKNWSDVMEVDFLI